MIIKIHNICAQSWHSRHSCVRFETKATVWTFLSPEFKWRNWQNADKFCGRACTLWILWYARIFWQFKSNFFPSLLFHDLKKHRRWQSFNIYRNQNIEITMQFSNRNRVFSLILDRQRSQGYSLWIGHATIQMEGHLYLYVYS